MTGAERIKWIIEMTMNELIDKSFEPYQLHIQELEKENAELKAAVDFQTSCNMDRYK